MENKSSSLVKDALILTIITVVAGVLLGLVYEVTKAPIAAANEAATQAAYREVFADAATFTEAEGFDAAAASDYVHSAGYEDDDVDAVLVAADASGTQLGYVITMTSHAGYGGDITFSMGITNDGVMNGYSITDISETAGLGMKAKEEKFMSEFKGIPVGAYEVTKTSPAGEFEIEAISGATITSRAMTGAVDAGMAYFTDKLSGGETSDTTGSSDGDAAGTDAASTEEGGAGNE